MKAAGSPKVNMADEATRIDLYNRIYQADRIVHPRKGALEPYGSHSERDAPFLEFLADRLPVHAAIEPPTVLDASCGRGHLALALAAHGYRVEASEIAPRVVENLRADGRLAAVHLATYGELPDAMRARRFDAVISNDVLEHLPEWDALIALKRLAALSKRYLLVSVGLGRGATNYPEALGLGRVDLHLFTPGAKRWLKEIERVGTIVETAQTPRTLWAFVEVKR